MDADRTWTTTELLLLAQAVQRHAENWTQVARVLGDHPAMQHAQPLKDCAQQWGLLLDAAKARAGASTAGGMSNKQGQRAVMVGDKDCVSEELPLASRITKHLFAQRVSELMQALAANEVQYRSITEDLMDIAMGKADDRLVELMATYASPPQEPMTVRDKCDDTHVGTKPGDDDADATKVKADVKAETETQTMAEAKAETNAEAKVKTEIEASVETKIETKTEATAETEGQAINTNEVKAIDATAQASSSDLMTNEAEEALAAPSVLSSDVPSPVLAPEHKSPATTATTVKDEPEQEMMVATPVALKEEPEVATATTEPALKLGDGDALCSSPAISDLATPRSVETPASARRAPRSRRTSESAAESATETVEDETEKARRKAWRKSVLMTYNTIASQRFSAPFLCPVKREDAEDYYDVIKRPMDLSTVKSNIIEGKIQTTTEFQRDVYLTLCNAFMYNSEHHVTFERAEEMFREARQVLTSLRILEANQQAASSAFAAVSTTPSPAPRASSGQTDDEVTGTKRLRKPVSASPVVSSSPSTLSPAAVSSGTGVAGVDSVSPRGSAAKRQRRA